LVVAKRVRFELTKADVLSALRRFDSDLRESAEWAAWEANKAHKYAVSHNDRLYPVKKVASLASGVPVSRFSGGEGSRQANALLRAAAFTIVTLRASNPDWVRDELILALALYLRHRPNPPDKASREIRDLSALLSRLGRRLFAGQSLSETFRNANGVYMKLMNFRRLDPRYTTGGRKGLSRGAKAEEDVWAEFASEPRRCDEAAAAIARELEHSPDEIPPLDFDDDFEEAPEGRLLTRKHVARERNRKLVDRKKRRVLRDTGRLECEVCGFDFAIRYGERGRGFIECHHIKPVTTLAQDSVTYLRDLAVVCANCHRIIHRGKPWLTLLELGALLVSSAKRV
jgi:5-methylcytosine-specific restriction protein A